MTMPTAHTFAYHPPAALTHGRKLRSHRWVGIASAFVLLAVPFIAVQQGEPGSAAAFAPLPSIHPLGATQVKGLPGEITPPALALDAAKPFVAAYGDAASALRAEHCLTEAIYYEGALEPERGQRAIAQVVLNRVRHPAYPDTVCGVVFQGSERSTGCQFTFTCDGSRARPPVPSLWRRANLIAKAALGGAVEPDVGLSTHYHADYVMPYWSASLNPAGQIGRHMFYRWKGGAGQAGAFSMRYAGREPSIPAWNPRPVGPQATDPQMAAAAAAGSTPMPEFTVAAAATDIPVTPPPATAPFKARPLLLAPKTAAKPADTIK